MTEAKHAARPRWTIYLPSALTVAVLAILVAGFFVVRADAASHQRSADAYLSLSRKLASTNDGNCQAAGTRCVGTTKQVLRSLPTAVQTEVSAAAGPAGAQGSPGQPGRNGTNGSTGSTGRGIVSTRITGGDLLVSYTDHTTTNAGHVQGATGTAGRPGRGITGTAIADQQLVVTYTDGSSKPLGRVVGPAGATGAVGAAGSNGTDGANGADGTNGQDGAAGLNGKDGANGTNGTDGRGIASLDEHDDLLSVTYTDGTTAVVGPLPSGPPGAAGKDGSPGYPPAGFTFTDELGTSYVCTPDGSADPGSQPHYSCTAQTSSPSPTPTATP